MAEEVIGPDANGNYSLVRDGVVVRTWNPTSTMGTMGTASAAPQTGRTSSFDASGNPLPIVQGTPVTQETVAPMDASAAPIEADTGGDDWFASPAPRTRTPQASYQGGGGYVPTDRGQQAATGDWFAAPPSGFGGTDNPFDNIPNYQDGTRHPAAGGSPRTPGGIFNDGQSGGTGITNYDTGASAYPGNVQSPRSEQPSSYAVENLRRQRGYNPGDDQGSKTHPLYDKMRAKGDAIESKVRAMADKLGMRRNGPAAAGSAGGGMSSSGDTASYRHQQQQYRRTGRRIEKATDRYNEALEDGIDAPVHGWAKQMGYKPGTIDAVLGDPTLILGDAVPGYESTGSFGGQAIERLPMTDMALMMHGTQNKRGLTMNAKKLQVPIPGILEREAGYEQPKLEKNEKRVLDSSDVTNKVAAMWRSLNDPNTAFGDLDFMDQEQLLGNLATSKKNSILRTNLESQFEEDPNAAMMSIASYLRSAMSVGQPSLAKQAGVRDVDRRITNMGGDLLRMKPEQASKFVAQLAQGYLDG
jgi:hypothetical protein